MPKQTHALPKVETRLTQADMDRLNVFAASSKRSKADIAREAIRWYLNNRERIANQQQEDQLSVTLKSMTDRICGMLARQSAQVGTLFELAWQTHVENEIEDRFHDAANHVKQKMRKRLTDDERAIAEKMKKVVR